MAARLPKIGRVFITSSQYVVLPYMYNKQVSADNVRPTRLQINIRNIHKLHEYNYLSMYLFSRSMNTSYLLAIILMAVPPYYVLSKIRFRWGCRIGQIFGFIKLRVCAVRCLQKKVTFCFWPVNRTSTPQSKASIFLYSY